MVVRRTTAVGGGAAASMWGNHSNSHGTLPHSTPSTYHVTGRRSSTGTIAPSSTTTSSSSSSSTTDWFSWGCVAFLLLYSMALSWHQMSSPPFAPRNRDAVSPNSPPPPPPRGSTHPQFQEPQPQETTHQNDPPHSYYHYYAHPDSYGLPPPPPRSNDDGQWLEDGEEGGGFFPSFDVAYSDDVAVMYEPTVGWYRPGSIRLNPLPPLPSYNLETHSPMNASVSELDSSSSSSSFHNNDKSSKHQINKKKPKKNKKKNKDRKSLLSFRRWFYHSSLQNSKIPRILIFTHQTNLLHPQHANPKHAQQYRSNIVRNIRLYVQQWQQHQQGSNGPSMRNQTVHASTTTTAVPRPRVWFLDNTECEGAIALVEPELVPHFQNETRGDFKGDLCRAAALYLSGGYYMDVDMKMISMLDFSSSSNNNNTKNMTRITFSSPMTTHLRFFNSFMAAEPRNVIVYNSLQIMLHYYRLRTRLLEQLLPRPQVLPPPSSQRKKDTKTNHDDSSPQTTTTTAKTQTVGERTKRAASMWGCDQQLNDTDVMVNYDPEYDLPRPSVCHMLEGGDEGMIGCYSLKAAYDYYYYHDQNDTLWTHPQVSSTPSTNQSQPQSSGPTEWWEKDGNSFENDNEMELYLHNEEEQQEPSEFNDDGLFAQNEGRGIPRTRIVPDNVFLLYEDDFNNKWKQKAWYPNLVFQNDGDGFGCNYLVHTRDPPQAYFFSRMIGGGAYCKVPKDKDGKPKKTTTTSTKSSFTSAATWSSLWSSLSQQPQPLKSSSNFSRADELAFQALHQEVEFFHLPSRQQLQQQNGRFKQGRKSNPRPHGGTTTTNPTSSKEARLG